MVPRPKIFALDASTPPADVGGLIVESGFSRIPVYQESIDNIIGLVYVKDVLRLLEKREPVMVRPILHPVHFAGDQPEATCKNHPGSFRTGPVQAC